MINFMLIITPEIILNFEKHHVCDKGLSQQAIKEHQAIYNAIENGNPKVAKQTMKEHFSELYKYCYNIK
jgi:transcriptional regulator, GntR family